MSKSFISPLSLQFHDEETESSFRSYNVMTEVKYALYFLVMVFVFNAIYVIKDYFFIPGRSLESISWQIFFFMPLNLMLIALVSQMKERKYTKYFYGVSVFIIVFTYFSQLWLLRLNGAELVGIQSIMLVVIFGAFMFSGVLYTHSLFLSPFLLMAILFFCVYVFDFHSYDAINISVIYCMTFTGLVLAKYQIEKEKRLSFNRSELLEKEDTMIKENYMEVNALSEMRKDLIAILAHDVRSPLASLHGVLQMAKSGDLSQQEAMSFMDKIESQVATVNFLVNDILIWIKSQSEEADLEKGAVNISSIVEELKYIFSDVLEEKGIHFTVNLSEELVFGQPDMIKSILRNLISNAVKFSRENNTITLKSSRTEDEKVSISVQDEGVGMSEDKLSKLKTSHSSSLGTKNETGMGLGLKICHALIYAHRSALEIESKLNHGTVMSFRLERP